MPFGVWDSYGHIIERFWKNGETEDKFYTI